MIASLFGCEVTELLHDGASTTVYRGRRQAGGEPVVLKVLKGREPSPSRVTALRHEAALIRGLAIDGVIRAQGLEQEQDSWALLLEDVGGTSLDRLGLAGRLSLERFLTLALALGDILQGLHQRRVVHKDLNPSHILIHPRDGTPRLIDFGIATVLEQETPAFRGPRGLEGTLAYMSPEQTGRMNRPLDYRTDYYSLGVTLYELLTGRHPFPTTDPLELVHAHVARQPPPPTSLDPSIPPAVSDIVLKLLAKSADDRYQSAHGLRADLEDCLAQLRTQGTVGPVSIGRHDRPEHFLFPRKLYGRTEETRRLLEVFERTDQGARLLLVSGPPGVGKTALLQEVYRPLTGRHGFFAAGKFEQAHRAPYGALRQVLRELVQQVLTESEARLAVLRERLGTALFPNGRVLFEVCPELALILGPQPEVSELPAAEARNRFNQAACQLVATLATPEHPLCVFLDDLQWADVDSLKLLEELMHWARELPLLLLGAYRDSEVGGAHPLVLSLREVEARGGRLERLSLAPLGQAEVTALLADTVSVRLDEAEPLAVLLLARTGGNPFFLRAFLQLLHADGLLRLTPEGWRWDLERIRQRGITDNVVELMVSRVSRLSPRTREVLGVAACLGARFELGTLGLALGAGPEVAGGDLWDAVAEGLVIPLDSVLSSVEMASAGPGVRCRFAHDRVQEAVLSTLGQGRAALHRDIGRRLLAGLDPEARRRALFDIVAQLNAGRFALEEADALAALAELNLEAASRALEGAASRQALGYARAGIALLGEEDWERRYPLAHGLHAVGAEAALLCSDLDTLEALGQGALRRARSVLDEVRLLKLQARAHFEQQRLDEARTLYLDLLRRLGFALPEAPTPEDIGAEMAAVAEAQGTRSIEDLDALPECTDARARLAMELLNRVVEAAGTGAANVFSLAVCRLVRMSLAHGNVPESSFGYAVYGILLVHGGDLDRAFRFGRMALRLADRMGHRLFRAQTYVYAHCYLTHWKTPLYDLARSFLDAYGYGLEAGSPFHAAGSAATLCMTRFLAGNELGLLAKDMGHYAEVIAQSNQVMVLGWLRIYQQAVANLREPSEAPHRLAGAFFDEALRVPEHQARNEAGTLFNYHYCKALLCYLFGEFEAAAASVDTCAPYAVLMGSGIHAAPWTLLVALCKLAVYEQTPEPERAALLAAVDAEQAKLERWRPHCPASIDHKLALVQAERARVLGHEDEARAAFERSVELARGGGYLSEEALACELAARFLLGRQQSRLGQYFLREAHHAWLRWGAVAKARWLEQRYSQLLPRTEARPLSDVGGAELGGFDALDLLSVLQASQVISSELDLRRLLVRLMKLLIETSGAQTGRLVLEHQGRWTVEAEKREDAPEPVILPSIPVEALAAQGHPGLPTSVLHYVARTRESVVLDDATASSRFGRDPHLVRHQVRSVLCLPLTMKGGRLGVIYLENNLTRGAFTPGRLRIVEMLSAQAVISLENALLYDTLEQKVELRTHELRAKNDELATTLRQLREMQDRLIIQDRLASLGALAAGIAHELRNPLNFINNFAELSLGIIHETVEDFQQTSGLDARLGEALKGSLTELSANLGRINEHGRRMEDIIRSMLYHSRETRGLREETDLGALVESSVRLTQQGMRSRIPSFSTAIELELDPQVGPVHVVPQELGRVCLNLLDNACYAVEARKKELPAHGYSPRIRVSTARRGNQVELRVHDNGTGIPEDIREKVFNPFFTTKSPGEGTGLGLSLCHEIITKGYGGTIQFVTEEGGFTEFIITFPAGRG